MMRFSSRFAVAITVVAAVAFATMQYAQRVPMQDGCTDTAALLDAAAFDPRTALVTDGAHASNVAAGRLTGRIPAELPGDPPLVFTVSRRYGLTRSLLQPAEALPGRREPDVVRPASLEVDGATLPFHYAFEEQGNYLRLTAYLMLHGSQAIESPFWALVEDAPRALFGGRRPITLFVASTMTNPWGRAETEARIEDWMRTAWRHHQAICGG